MALYVSQVFHAASSDKSAGLKGKFLMKKTMQAMFNCYADCFRHASISGYHWAWFSSVVFAYFSSPRCRVQTYISVVHGIDV